MVRVTRAILRFGATLGNRKLSNFARCKVSGPFGHLYPSSEHAWQASKAKNERLAKRFAQGGDLAEMTLGVFKKLYPKTADEKLQKKLAYWSRGDSVGIIAKMAANKKHAKKLGIDTAEYAYEREHMSETDLDAVWLPILREKYTKNADMRETLLATSDRHLLEFDRGARKRGSFWGGLNEEDGTVIGRNYMGELLMKVREELKQKSKKK